MVKNTYYCSEQTMKQYRMIENLDYEMHHDLAVEYVNDGIVYPLERNICPDYEQYGGVTDKNGNFIRLSLLDRHIFDHEDALKPYRDWYIGANPKYERQDIKKLMKPLFFRRIVPPLLSCRIGNAVPNLVFSGPSVLQSSLYCRS